MLRWEYRHGNAYLTFFGKTFSASEAAGDHPSGFVSVNFINNEMQKICKQCKFCCTVTLFRPALNYLMAVRVARLLYAVSAFESE